MLQIVYRLPFLWIVSLILMLAQATPCQAKMISVELVWNLSQAGWVQIDIKKGDYQLILDTTTRKFPAGSTLQVGWGGWTPVLRVNHEEFQVFSGSVLEVKETNPGSLHVKTPEGIDAVYRGGLQLNWQDGHWRIINQLDSEDYLKGVVPIEMSNEWAKGGVEALKAQAVAARTYLVRQTENGKKMITDSPDIHQAYAGMKVEGEASKAIEATRGEIIVDAKTKQPIDALYSSHSGGYTEDAQNVWGNIDIHNISHPDLYSQGVGGPVNRWRFIVSAPLLGSKFGLGPVRKVTLDKFPSGRVKSVQIEDEFGQNKTVKGRTFVQAFYPFGQPIRKEAFLGSLFEAKDVNTNRELFRKSDSTESFGPLGYSGFSELAKLYQSRQGPLLSKVMSSSLGTSEDPQPFGVFIFEGRGWGHGVGMSQWGAYHMAQLGYKYNEIIAYYYNHISIGQSSL
ncbi:SpoIID/LytB domain-containing protein [Desulfosporosinus sp.]|uniref:SpoIID/LytB domain-containing protein n=1 Tax=Desulfosporosinus sp. TaxID=157907 RepID=UPI0025B956BE|nr:SpoIID/LytB domain-containing protein [Desulfosporosinus sp.]MBC2722323.1 SpoIID/LytB domain-containing protein [Desulfosporosinus sp.]MBC2727756.1 SpoIID/LytB domain-containing protein [Desulfosporosinus sp.]